MDSVINSQYDDTWIKHYWRPAIAWSYLLICLFDFIIFPSLSYAYAYYTKTPYVQWDPLTLKLSGFYHLSMGAIIGVSSWTRGQEKIQRLSNGDSDAESVTTTQVAK